MQTDQQHARGVLRRAEIDISQCVRCRALCTLVATAYRQYAGFPLQPSANSVRHFLRTDMPYVDPTPETVAAVHGMIQTFILQLPQEFQRRDFNAIALFVLDISRRDMDVAKHISRLTVPGALACNEAVLDVAVVVHDAISRNRDASVSLDGIIAFLLVAFANFVSPHATVHNVRHSRLPPRKRFPKAPVVVSRRGRFPRSQGYRKRYPVRASQCPLPTA